MQLEKIIGKVKTEKYGSQILEQVRMYADAKQPVEDNEQEIENRSSKRLKNTEPLLIESSDDET